MPDTAAPRPDLAPVLAHLDGDREGALERLFTLLRTQSVSTDPAFAPECRKAAEWLVADLAAIGFDARLHEGRGHPLVLAHDLSAPGPHILFYGHYDVQPVDPLNLWEGDPFEPVLLAREDGSQYIRARGASDDKGQVMTFIEACRAYKATHGALPCKISILLEGEEETAGHVLADFLASEPEELRADLALVCDTAMWNATTPAITTMLRGNVAEEVHLSAPDRDLHSGFFGGAATNPLHELSRVLAKLHDDSGRVQIPGFYEGVPEVPETVRAQWRALDFDLEVFLGGVGLKTPAGEDGYSALEMTWSRPTAEVNGIWGGYTGAGFKTVIPAEAHAKVSFRLVGMQDPKTIRARFRSFVEDNVGPDVRVRFTAHGGGAATVMPTEAPAFEAARQALTREWGKEAAFIGCGGSIPVVSAFKQDLGLDTLLIGFGLEDDRIHSPNEKYELRSFTGGCRSWVRVLDALSP
ncbi:MAG: M20/M25/M40 family metallo-hydrolase [Pseudomonadota bacterium]